MFSQIANVQLQHFEKDNNFLISQLLYLTRIQKPVETKTDAW